MKTPVTELPRRFYRAATAGPEAAGHAVRLDGRTPKSPAGRPLILPTAGLASLLAAEWERQGAHIDFGSMPATRLAHTALDAIPAARADTADEIARYGGSDALCYLADGPQGLVQRQLEQWSPWLDWARDHLGVALAPTTGIVHHPQTPEALTRIRELAEAGDDFRLAGLAFATALYGSAVLAFAVAHRRLSGEAAYELSRLDEAYQEEQWGVDEEAAQRTARLRRDAAMVEAWFAALA